MERRRGSIANRFGTPKVLDGGIDFEHSSPTAPSRTRTPSRPAKKRSKPRSCAKNMAKRKQVKNACVNCQRACKKCDDQRPCSRCVKYSIEDSCINSSRKERKRGFKRGPYQRRSRRDSPSDSTPSGQESVQGTSTSQSSSDMPFEANTDRLLELYRTRAEYRESGVSRDGPRPTAVETTSRIPNLVVKKHLALFKMVLSAMHGDLDLPADQPTLRDLAAVCAEVAELEQSQRIKPDPGQFEISLYDTDRTNSNRTPVSSPTIPRDVFTPPNTPVFTKTMGPLHYGSLVAPPPPSGPLPLPPSANACPPMYCYYPRNG